MLLLLLLLLLLLPAHQLAQLEVAQFELPPKIQFLLGLSKSLLNRPGLALH